MHCNVKSFCFTPKEFIFFLYAPPCRHKKCLTFKRSHLQPCYQLKKKNCSVVYLCRSTVLQHQPFQHKRSLFPNPLLTPYVCYNSQCHLLSALPECTVCLQEACRACLMGFSEVFDVCARHCNTLKMGHWYDVLQSVIMIHRVQCEFLTLCLEFP